MLEALGTVAAFLLEHGDLVDLICQAICGGVSKDALKKAIRAEMVAASDATMKAELGG